MNNFTYVRAHDLSGAGRLVAGNDGAKFIGGGTNLVDLMKYAVERPTTLVDLNSLDLREVTELPSGGVRIGALATNSNVAYHPSSRRGTLCSREPSLPVLAHSCATRPLLAAIFCSEPAACTSTTRPSPVTNGSPARDVLRERA